MLLSQNLYFFLQFVKNHENVRFFYKFSLKYVNIFYKIFPDFFQDFPKFFQDIRRFFPTFFPRVFKSLCKTPVFSHVTNSYDEMGYFIHGRSASWHGIYQKFSCLNLKPYRRQSILNIFFIKNWLKEPDFISKFRINFAKFSCSISNVLP